MSEKLHIVRTIEYTPPSQEKVVEVLRILASLRFTGKVTINLSQGGIGSITAEEIQKIPLPI